MDDAGTGFDVAVEIDVLGDRVELAHFQCQQTLSRFSSIRTTARTSHLLRVLIRADLAGGVLTHVHIAELGFQHLPIFSLKEFASDFCDSILTWLTS